ncbi:MAG: hypothetical protein AMXMBFR57_32120 [Acidimicrobiia bacterium]
MNWLHAIYEVVGTPIPRLSIVIAAAIGALLFGGGWWLVGREYAKSTIAVVAPPSPGASLGPTLLPQQLRLLELLVQYQRQFAATKLVISRSDGTLHFDDAPERGKGVSLLLDLYGSSDERNAGRFEELMESMPSQYIRLIAESRWDNPFVVSATAEGVELLGRPLAVLHGLRFVLLTDLQTRLLPDGSEVIECEFRLLNVSTPPAEVSNIFGHVWIDRASFVGSNLPPARGLPGVGRVEWDIQIPTFPKESVFIPTKIVAKAPQGDAYITIGAQFVSKETDKQEYLWHIRHESGTRRIVRLKGGGLPEQQ